MAPSTDDILKKYGAREAALSGRSNCSIRNRSVFNATLSHGILTCSAMEVFCNGS